MSYDPSNDLTAPTGEDQLLKQKVSMFMLPTKENVIKFIPVMTDVNNLTGWYPTSDVTTNYGSAKFYQRATSSVDMSGTS